jgi:hypothetical protein
MGHKKLVHGAGTFGTKLIQGDFLLYFIQIGFPRALENEVTY